MKNLKNSKILACDAIEKEFDRDRDENFAEFRTEGWGSAKRISIHRPSRNYGVDISLIIPCERRNRWSGQPITN